MNQSTHSEVLNVLKSHCGALVTDTYRESIHKAARRGLVMMPLSGLNIDNTIIRMSRLIRRIVYLCTS